MQLQRLRGAHLPTIKYIKNMSKDTQEGNTASQNVTSNILDTVYQNTTGKVKFVTIQLFLTVEITSGTTMNGMADVVCYSENVNPPTIEVAQGRTDVTLTGLTSTINRVSPALSLSFIVPPNYYYKAELTETGDGAVSLIDWVEWTLG